MAATDVGAEVIMLLLVVLAVMVGSMAADRWSLWLARNDEVVGPPQRSPLMAGSRDRSLRGKTRVRARREARKS